MQRSALDQIALNVSGLCKSYDGFDVLRGVNFTINRGEVVALLGDNGAGKSTLVQILAGLTQPDNGQINVGKKPQRLSSPSASQKAGMAVVHQDLALVQELSVVENLFLNREIVHRNRFLRALGWLDKKAMSRKAQKLLLRLGMTVADIHSPVNSLSGGQKQAIAIIRAVYAGADIIIMDEPTAALGAEQCARLVSLIRLLSSQGIAIVLISHNLRQVDALCDRAVILFEGQTIADVAIDEVNQAQLLAYMSGAQSDIAKVS